MKKLQKYLNYIALALLLVGFAMYSSLGSGNFWGIVLIILGIVGFTAYFVMNRERLKDKNSRLNFLFASNIVVIVILIIAIVAAVNYLGVKIHARADFTEGKIHSISDQSVKVVKALKDTLNIKAFFEEGNPKAQAYKQLIEIYQYYSAKLKSEVIDPYKNPAVVKRYEVKTIGTLILEYGKKDMRIEETSEEALTNAMIKLTREEEKVIYFTSGHGEPSLEKSEELEFSEVKSNLEKQAYKVKKLLLSEEPAVPSDAAVVVVAGPQKSLLDKELQLLDQYIFQRQGRVLLLIDPNQSAELLPLCKKLGVIFEDTIVVEADPMSRVVGGSAVMPVVGRYGSHEITKNFEFYTIFPMARSLVKTTPAPQNVTVTMLASTSPNSWADKNFTAEQKSNKIIKDPDEKIGPIDIAAAVEIGYGDKNSRAVIVGNAGFAVNRYYVNFNFGNGNLFNNMIAWLAKEGDLIAIAPKSNGPRMLTMTQGDSSLLFFYTLVILPLLIFLTGIGIWFYRRKL